MITIEEYKTSHQALSLWPKICFSMIRRQNFTSLHCMRTLAKLSIHGPSIRHAYMHNAFDVMSYSHVAHTMFIFFVLSQDIVENENRRNFYFYWFVIKMTFHVSRWLWLVLIAKRMYTEITRLSFLYYSWWKQQDFVWK